MSSLLTEKLDQRLERLPPFPQAATRALEELRRDNVDFARLEHVIGSDPVLTARILRIANSPFYGLPRKIAAVKDACMLTGAPALRNLIIASVAMRQFSPDKTTRADHTAVWRHSAQCAAFATELAHLAHQPRDVAFTAGLLHDIGKLALASLFAEEYVRIRAKGGTLDAEQEVLGTTHADIGARIVELWRLPLALRDAVAAHHNPPPAELATLADVIHAADALTHAMDEGTDEAQAWSRVHDTVLARLSLDAAARTALYQHGQALAKSAADLFSGM